MLTNLGYYGPKANTQLTASILFAQFFMPFTPYFVVTGLKPKRTTVPGGGTVPGERLQEDLKNQ